MKPFLKERGRRYKSYQEGKVCRGECIRKGKRDILTLGRAKDLLRCGGAGSAGTLACLMGGDREGSGLVLTMQDHARGGICGGAGERKEKKDGKKEETRAHEGEKA